MKTIILSLFFGTCLFLGIKLPHLVGYLKADKGEHSYFYSDKRDLNAVEVQHDFGGLQDKTDYYSETKYIGHVVFTPFGYEEQDQELSTGHYKISTN